jgi:tetratricopeptide (TPR) repeat protein
MADHKGGSILEESGELEPDGSATTRRLLAETRTDPALRRLVLPERAPHSSSTSLRMVLLVAISAVITTLAMVFFAYRALGPAATPAGVAGLSLAATPVVQQSDTGTSTGAAVPHSPLATPPAAAVASAGACTRPLGEAQALVQARRWADAAVRLESVRNQCDVVGPLYDVYLDQGRALADDERGAEAITFFDKALQVKNGSEATSEKALAVAYQDGRAALDRGDLDAAIANLSRVQSTRPGYARGNSARNLITAYVAQGDALVTQSKCAEALTYFERANVLKPNERAITQRISSAQQCARPTPVPARRLS